MTRQEVLQQSQRAPNVYRRCLKCNKTIVRSPGKFLCPACRSHNQRVRESAAYCILYSR
jgi:Zn finger protein HypA/HybF involved in hydrogenase expression